MNELRPRVAVVHPRLVPGGGSEASTVWALQALQDEYRLTLITMGRPDLAALNAKYGTSLDERKIERRLLTVPLCMRKRFDALRGFRLARYVRRHAGRFDVVISAYGLFDFGRIAIQRIGDFSFDDGLRSELHPAGGAVRRSIYNRSPARSLYLALGRILSGGDQHAWKKDRLAANSKWTRDLLRERFGVPSEVIYPPVAGVTDSIPWAERADGFVVMARLVPEKGILFVVDVLRRVRKSRDVHLHVLGRRDDAAYVRELEKAQRENADWMSLEGEVYGADKARFLAEHRYGISGCRQEAFGIAAAEMVKAGCLVWVPDGGGQTEIVSHPELIYLDHDDAAAKILSVLADPGKQSALRDHLKSRAEMFSTERYVREMRTLVRAFLEENRAEA
jgi:glycosyltransferase involved in cell wall biosynthesis